MSYKDSYAAQKVTGLSPLGRSILTFLASKTNAKDGKRSCFVKISTICAHVGRRERMVQYELAKLRKAGVIETSLRQRKNGSTSCNKFIMLFPLSGVQSIAPSPPDMVQPIAPLLNQGSSDLNQDAFSEALDQTVSAITIPDSTHQVGKIANLNLQYSKGPSKWVFDVEGLPFGSVEEIIKAQIVEDLKKSEFDLLAEDVLKAKTTKLSPIQAINKARKKDGSYSAKSLAQLWLDLSVIYEIGGFLLPLTQKDSSSLKVLSYKFCKDVDIGEVMAVCLAAWLSFGKFVKGQGVTHDFPDQPHVGFFIKHAPLAIQFYDSGVKIPTTAKSKGIKKFDPNE